MDARIIDKTIEVEGRRFTVRKYDAFTGVKISKLMITKLLPMIQSAFPLIREALAAGNGTDAKALGEKLLDNLDSYLSLEKVAHALDLITGPDLESLISSSLMHCYEQLPGGSAQVMRSDRTYGVDGVEYDPLVVIRLVCESIMWGLSDFFTADRLTSVFGPIFSIFQPSSSTSMPFSSPL